MRKRNAKKRLLSALLALTMVLSWVPMSAVALDTTTVTGQFTGTGDGSGKTPETLEVTGSTAYEVGDAIKAPQAVVVKYTDGTSETLTSGWELSSVSPASGVADGKFIAAGQYALTYTCTIDTYQAQAVLNVTVTEPTSAVADIETESKSAVVEGTSSTINVWALTDSITAGNTYLIVNTNEAGDGYALLNNNGTVAAVEVEVVDDGTNAPYIVLANNNAVWTFTGSEGAWNVKNSSHYLNYTYDEEEGWFGSTYSNFALALLTSAVTWATDGDNLYFNKGSLNPYGLTYSNGWALERTSVLNPTYPNVYFYTPTTITSGTVGYTYSVVGTNITNAVAISGSTLLLTSTLTDTPTEGDASDITNSGEWTRTYEVVTTKGTPTVISKIENGVATLSGIAGTAVVRVTYTSGDLVAWDEFLVTATAPVYDLQITNPGSAQIKIGTTTALSAVASLNGAAIDDATITWSSSDSTIASVDANGNVTGEKSGSATITASWTDPNGTTHTDTLTLEVVDAVYSLDLAEPTYTPVTDTSDTSKTYFIKQPDGSYIAVTDTSDTSKTYYTQSTVSITAPIIVKDVVDGQGYTNIWALIYADGVDIGKLSDEQLEKLTYVSSNESIATVDKTTGYVTFKGTKGTVTITAIYEYADGKSVADSVIFSVSDDHYYVPEDGTDDFPEYPNEGAIRFDKTATAVGNFSETGIVQVELSMTGVPYTTGSEMDVVVMLDQSTSMDEDRISATVAATKAFIQSIVINEDGTYNDNRIYVGYFNGDVTYDITDADNIGGDLASVDNKTELDALFADIDSEFDGSPSATGTNYAVSLQKCYDRLNTAKKDGVGSDRQQFCLFMSDGVPTDYQTAVSTTVETSAIQAMFTGTDYGTRDTDYIYEYYSTAMKAAEVTIYTVGLGLNAKNSAWNSASATQCLNAASILLNDISGPAGETTQPDALSTTTLSKKDSFFYSVDDADAAASMSTVFKNIAQKILDAAKDVKVEDKMSDNFSMVFEAPNPTVSENLPEGQEFYIEVKDYALTPIYGSDGTTITDYTRGTATSLMKLYLGTSEGTYYAASDAKGTKYADPVFSQTALGTKYYWTTNTTKADTYIDENGEKQYSVMVPVTSGDVKTIYYFTTEGDGEYNLTSGAYASGTKDSEGTSQNLIIATPYFVYNADSKILVWTVEKLSSSELALSYFLYLDYSAGYENTDKYIPAGTYETNGYAKLTYENFQETECEQELPVPQITYNGAQVSYVFYLVNEQGQPVNRAGRVVPFSEAVYVTDVFTESVTWQGHEQTTSLDSQYIAENLLPSVYKLYDSDAKYTIHVFRDDSVMSNHFKIEGSAEVNTTYVFNTKAGDKYSAPGIYAAQKSINCKDYNVTQNADGSYTYNGDGTKQYTDSSGNAVYGTDNLGYYTIVNASADKVITNFDYANTTVAFAVVWEPKLETDTVVVDFGLDVVIDVTINDAIAGGVVGVRTDAPDVQIGSGTYDADKGVTTDLYIDDMKIGTASVESLTSVRFSFDKTNGMKFTKPVTFYYESEVTYYDSDNVFQTTCMYSSVTVIPAATIYYEEEFLTLNSHGADDPQWSTTTDAEISVQQDSEQTSGTATNSLRVQATDRPGNNLVSDAYDANNLYGFDSAYEKDIFYSLGTASKVTVKTNQYATAEFTFTGTGFDVIALTSNTTGVMVAQVYDSTGSEVRTIFVDTYFGYTYDADTGKWEPNENADPSVLYQIPIITATELSYGTYRVVLTASYHDYFDHTSPAGYELYLDAVRIYDPAGVVAGTVSNTTVSGAYEQDGEMIPTYQELRDNMITNNSLGTNGAVFVDGIPNAVNIADYSTYGPNNELYLAPGQAILFNLANPEVIQALHIGLSSVSGDVEFYIFNADAISKPVDVQQQTKLTLTTSTDMYYDVTAMKGGTILIYNRAKENDDDNYNSILSITTLKIVAESALTFSATGVVSENTLSNILFALGGTLMDDPDTENGGDQSTDGGNDDTNPDTDDPGTDDPGTDNPSTDDPGTDNPGTDNPGTDDPGTDDPGVDDPTDATDPGATDGNTDSGDATTDGESNGTSKTVLVVAIVGGAALLMASIIVLLKKLLGGR